jgi:hypothetical protein
LSSKARAVVSLRLRARSLGLGAREAAVLCLRLLPTACLPSARLPTACLLLLAEPLGSTSGCSSILHSQSIIRLNLLSAPALHPAAA